MISLESIGWTAAFSDKLEQARLRLQNPHLQPARVAVEQRGAYQLIATSGAAWAETTGRMRHQARDRLELPAVGDWVAVRRDGRIDALLERTSAVVRKVAGHRVEPQVIAANVDFVFIVTSANQDFNVRRIERYVSAIGDGGAVPVLVVNKTDLRTDVGALLASLGPVGSGLSVARVSALERRGRGELEPFVGAGRTLALVGSSGVGKSTLANWLLGEDLLDTQEIRRHDAHGRHTTTHRELAPLPGGGALIDTPGMRELSLWVSEADLEGPFADVESLMKQCRFADCQHQGQPGCALEAALQSGRLDPGRLQSYRKLRSELTSQAQRGTRAAYEDKRTLGKSRVKALRSSRRGPFGGKLH